MDFGIKRENSNPRKTSKKARNQSPETDLRTLQSQELRDKLRRIEEEKQNQVARQQDRKPILTSRSNKWRMIAMYAEKGGVGKSTITVTLGYMLASMGKRVLLYDCDSQRSLTSWCFGKEINVNYGENVDEFIQNVQLDQGCDRTLYDQVDQKPRLDITKPVSPAHAVQVDINLYVVMGNRDTCLLDERISMSEQNAPGNFSAFNVYAARPFLGIEATVKKYDIEYVLLDLNPVRGTLNKRLISISDYLIVPCFADYYGFNIMSHLYEDLVQWNKELDASRETANLTPFPIPAKEPVKFLGFIVNNYQPVKGHYDPLKNGIAMDTMRKNQQYWLDKIIASAKVFPLYGSGRKNQLLAKVRNYWQLEQISSLFFIPVPLLRVEHAWRRAGEEGNDNDERSERSDEEELFVKMSNQQINSVVTYDLVEKETRQGKIRHPKRMGKHGYLVQVQYFKTIYEELTRRIIQIIEETS